MKRRIIGYFAWLAITWCMAAPAFGQNAPFRIYLAGPLGFSEAGRSYKDTVLIPQLRALGYEIVDPFQLTSQSKIDAVGKLSYADQRDAWRALNPEIARNNQAGIDRSDAVVAILDGPDVDSGTAAEIGYAYARGKPIIGYRGDFRLSADNAGSTVNLQVEHFIRQSGGEIVTAANQLPQALMSLRSRAQSASSQIAPQNLGAGSTKIPSKELLDVIDFYIRMFGIVLALALAEAFKQSVSDRDESRSVVLWDRVWALASFFLLIAPFFQGMNRYFSVTYGDLNHLPNHYAGFLMFDGFMFTLEAAVFFVMSRALAPAKWVRFYCWVLTLLVVDTIWAAVAFWGHGADVFSWMVLNFGFGAVFSAILFWRKWSTRLSLVWMPAICLVLVFLRTATDYYLMWNNYFPSA